MPSKVSQSPRSRRNRLERINIDELFDSPSNRGMLSFLERAPEEARARLEERRKVDAAEAALTSLPRASDVREAPSNLADREPRSKLPAQVLSEGDATATVEDKPTVGGLAGGYDLNSELSTYGPPPVGELAPECYLLSVGDLHTGGVLPTPLDVTGKIEARNRDTHNKEDLTALAPVGEPPTGAHLPSLHCPPTGHLLATTTKLYSKVLQIEKAVSANDSAIPPTARGSRQSPSAEQSPATNLPTAGDSPTRIPLSLFRRTVSNQTIAGGKLPTDVIDGIIIGRRQKIRRAVVAQDGHSSGEQLLYQALWNAARPESGSLDHRTIVAGYQGMSALCKLDKKNCKKNAKGLIDKLALEVAETYRSDERIGTTYRIFSYKEILRRREAAGMVWVVRTSGVRFVPLGDKRDQAGNGLTYAESDDSKASASLGTAVGNLPPGLGNSPMDPVGNWSMASVGGSPRHTVGGAPTLLGTDRNTHQETSSAFPRQLGPKLRALLPSFDDDAARQLWTRCSQIAPDCTEEDIEYCFQIKAHQLLRGRKKIDNPVGIMIWSVPKTFEGTDPLYLRRRLEIERIRKAEEEERQRSRATLMEMLEDSTTSAEDKATIRRLLEEK